jgi:hypothetical protein
VWLYCCVLRAAVFEGVYGFLLTNVFFLACFVFPSVPIRATETHPLSKVHCSHSVVVIF